MIWQTWWGVTAVWCVWSRWGGQCRTETREAGWERRARDGGEQLPWPGGLCSQGVA